MRGLWETFKRYPFLTAVAVAVWVGVIFGLTGVSVGNGHAEHPVVLGR